MTEIIFEIVSFIFRLVFDIIMVWTGEIVLFIITLGRHRPRWDQYTSETFGRFVVFTEISLWIGVLLGISIILLLIRIFGEG